MKLVGYRTSESGMSAVRSREAGKLSTRTDWLHMHSSWLSIIGGRCQVTITHSNTRGQQKKAILTSKTDVKSGRRISTATMIAQLSRRSPLSPSANLKRSLISRLMTRRRVGEELHTCNTGSTGHVQGHGLRASQAASGPALGMNSGRELWTTRAQPWCRVCKWFWRVLEQSLGSLDAQKGLGGEAIFI